MKHYGDSMDLSVVIVNFNTRGRLEECLGSLYDVEDDLDIEIIVVDNNSKDGSTEMVKEKFSEASLIINKENTGYAAANNQGITVSSGRNILVLNSDTIVRTGALNAMSDYLDKHEDTGMVGCKMIFPDGSFQGTCCIFPTARSMLVSLFKFLGRVPVLKNFKTAHLLPMKEYENEVECDFITGAAMMVPRRVIEKAGPMDAGFRLFFEETDWARRIKNAGYAIRYIEGGEIIHYGGESTHQVPARSSEDYIRSMVRYFGLHHGAGEANVVKWAASAWLFLRIILLKLKLPFSVSARLRLKSYLKLLKELVG